MTKVYSSLNKSQAFICSRLYILSKKELRNFKDHIGESATSHPLIGSNLFLKLNAQIPFLVLKKDTEKNSYQIQDEETYL